MSRSTAQCPRCQLDSVGNFSSSGRYLPKQSRRGGILPTPLPLPWQWERRHPVKHGKKPKILQREGTVVATRITSSSFHLVKMELFLVKMTRKYGGGYRLRQQVKELNGVKYSGTGFQALAIQDCGSFLRPTSKKTEMRLALIWGSEIMHGYASRCGHGVSYLQRPHASMCEHQVRVPAILALPHAVESTMSGIYRKVARFLRGRALDARDGFDELRFLPLTRQSSPMIA